LLIVVFEKPEDRKITDWVDPKDKTGEFKRGGSKFRNSVSNAEGAEFPAEIDRYHLYVSYACPWGMFTSRFYFLVHDGWGASAA
jgi:glutathionyl-hydroquinone reductase